MLLLEDPYDLDEGLNTLINRMNLADCPVPETIVLEHDVFPPSSP